MALHGYQLWMGDIDPYMTVEFLQEAFERTGVPIIAAEIVKDKVTNSNIGYAYVTFPDSDAAQHAIVKLNGRTIPLSNPVKHFILNPLPNKDPVADERPGNKKEYQLFVWDLSREVDDIMLYCAFAKKYPSCLRARVCVDTAGRRKGYGFIVFGTELDQQKALIEMQHMTGVGRTPFRLSLIGHQKPMPFPNYTQTQYYNEIYPQFLQYKNEQMMSFLEDQQNKQIEHLMKQCGELDEVGWARYYDPMYDELPEAPKISVDVDKTNGRYFIEAEEVYDAMDASMWYPIDNVLAKLD